jgi:hypothetical protein
VSLVSVFDFRCFHSSHFSNLAFLSLIPYTAFVTELLRFFCFSTLFGGFHMPSVAPYIPNKDAALDSWLANFSALISAAPGSYGLTPAEALIIEDSVESWHGAYVPVTSPSTKTPQAVSLKNTSKVNTLAIIRPFAQTIGLNQGVPAASKIALGLNPRSSTPSPVSPPVSNPILTVQGASNLALFLRYRDSSASVSVKSKPYGVTRCRISRLVSATPVTDPTLLQFAVDATKSPLTLTFAPTDGGKTVYMAAQWVIRTGGVSPWSPIVAYTVPIGS